MKKITKKSIILIIVILLAIIFISFKLLNNAKEELRTVKSDKQLLRFYEGDNEISDFQEVALKILTMPFSFFVDGFYPYYRRFCC